MTAINLQANRAEFRRYLTLLETMAPRFPAHAGGYRRPWYRRWLDVLIRGFLIWYSVVIVGLAVVMLQGC